jgi:hypothetical protein
MNSTLNTVKRKASRTYLNNESDKPFTEKDAAIAYAKAWNSLDCSEFLELLDDNAHYSSMTVWEELENKEAITDYLTNKLQAVEKGNAPVKAELGFTVSGFAGQHCSILTQYDENNKKSAVILFKIKGNKIAQYTLCLPGVVGAKGSEVIPV